MPAIDVCLREAVGELPRVVKAWPMNRGLVGVRLQNINAGRHECVAAASGAAVDRVEQLAFGAPAMPGEGDPIFTPAAGAYPGAACFGHERVEIGEGVFRGWLSSRIC